MLSDTTQRKNSKTSVAKACVNCRRAHLACNVERPCKRCVSLNKQDTCYDVDHKKRGRPKCQLNRPKPAKASPYYNIPVTRPSYSQSSFRMTEIASNNNSAFASTPVVTALLSMEICCARVSDEIQELLGYYPQELAHRSLHSFISPKSSNTISRIHRYLLDNVVTTAQKVDPGYQYRNTPPTERTSSEKFFNMDPQTLCTIANGSQTFTDLIYFKRNNGSTECLQSQFCLGGGMGANLFDPSSLGSLYIICLLSKAPVASSKRDATPAEPVVLTSEPQPMSVQLVHPQPQWNMTYQEESAFSFSNENTGMSFLETPPDTTATATLKDAHMESSPEDTADDDDNYSLPACSRVSSVYSESSVSSNSNNNSTANKDDVGILNYPIALSNAILSTEPNKQPFTKSLEQSTKKPIQQSEFIKPNSVIHVAPISEKPSEDSVFFDYFKKAVQQEEKKKPMFDTQTSTLFRALDDIAKQDLEKKLSEECQATTSFMSVDALLS